MKHRAVFLSTAFLSAAGLVAVADPVGPVVTRMANGDVLIAQTTAPNTYHRIEASPDLETWQPLFTLRSSGALNHTDSAAPYFGQRFYRVLPLATAPVLTGDHLATSAGEVVIHSVDHASFVMTWNGKTIYNDPVGGAAPYANFPRADLILVSHSHGDHFNGATLTAVLATGGQIIAPQAVYNSLSAPLKAATTIMLTGQTNPANNTPAQSVIGLTVEAIPAYNANHALGTGNGYVLTIDDQRLYMSGDTGDTAEMRALSNIDVAFVCMNVPFTMTIPQAVSAVRQFRPRVVFPYHYRNQNGSLADLAGFKQQVGTDLGIEVRLRPWYASEAAPQVKLRKKKKKRR
ncbi:MAG: MBL fold metallo-hydrolase [Chthoniobacteraceae bacterium]